MNYGEVKTLVAEYLDRDDLTSKIPTFIKLAIKRLERPSTNNFRHMIKQVPGTLTDDYLSVPSDYKEAKALFITANSQKYAMHRTSYYDLIRSYPLGSDSKTIPGAFAYLNSKFYLRPYPDSTYPYELVYYAYTADLSADEDENFWTTTGIDALLFTVLLEAIPYLNYSDTQIAIWKEKANEAVGALLDTETSEVISGSHQGIGMPRPNPFNFNNC